MYIPKKGVLPMKKLMKACTLSLAALGALTFFQTEGAHAAAQPKEPVIAKAPIMKKVITGNRQLLEGLHLDPCCTTRFCYSVLL